MVGQLFDIYPLHIPLGIPKTPKCWFTKVKVAFPIPKYWNSGVLAVGLSCFYFGNLFSAMTELEWQIFQDKKEVSFDTNTYTQTYTRTRAHTHNLDFSVSYGAHHLLSTASLFEFDSKKILLCLLCYVVLVLLCTLSTTVIFSI